MEKGKYGVKLCFYTVTAFLLAYFGYTTLLFLVAGAVLFAEKSEWAFKQVIQAICLVFVAELVSAVIRILNIIPDTLSRLPLPGFIFSAWNSFTGLVGTAVDVVVLIFCILAIVNNLKGKDAGIVGAKKVADWAYGAVSAKTENGNQ